MRLWPRPSRKAMLQIGIRESLGEFEKPRRKALARAPSQDVYLCASASLLRRLLGCFVGRRKSAASKLLCSLGTREWSGRADLNCRTARALHESPRKSFIPAHTFGV